MKLLRLVLLLIIVTSPLAAVTSAEYEQALLRAERGTTGERAAAFREARARLRRMRIIAAFRSNGTLYVRGTIRSAPFEFRFREHTLRAPSALTAQPEKILARVLTPAQETTLGLQSAVKAEFHFLTAEYLRAARRDDAKYRRAILSRLEQLQGLRWLEQDFQSKFLAVAWDDPQLHSELRNFLKRLAPKKIHPALYPMLRDSLKLPEFSSVITPEHVRNDPKLKQLIKEVAPETAETKAFLLHLETHAHVILSDPMLRSEHLQILRALRNASLQFQTIALNYCNSQDPEVIDPAAYAFAFRQLDNVHRKRFRVGVNLSSINGDLLYEVTRALWKRAPSNSLIGKIIKEALNKTEDPVFLKWFQFDIERQEKYFEENKNPAGKKEFYKKRAIELRNRIIDQGPNAPQRANEILMMLHYLLCDDTGALILWEDMFRRISPLPLPELPLALPDPPATPSALQRDAHARGLISSTIVSFLLRTQTLSVNPPFPLQTLTKDLGEFLETWRQWWQNLDAPAPVETMIEYLDVLLTHWQSQGFSEPTLQQWLLALDWRAPYRAAIEKMIWELNQIADATPQIEQQREIVFTAMNDFYAALPGLERKEVATLYQNLEPPIKTLYDLIEQSQ